MIQDLISEKSESEIDEKEEKKKKNLISKAQNSDILISRISYPK